jgi:hypothetical protein
MAGGLNSRIGAAQWYDGQAHTLRTQFNYWHPAAPYDWWQTIEDCGPLIHICDCYQIGKGLKMGHKSLLKSHLSTHVFYMR